MKLEEVVQKRPYVYHLTDARNLELILKHKLIYSYASILDLTKQSKDEKQTLLTERREYHRSVALNGEVFHIRDQKPISLKALSKCLTDNWKTGDFINHLNIRVFFWPTIERLKRHFRRYSSESPIILRFKIEDIIQLNEKIEYCRLNSGATRANSFLGGIPPRRGKDTFLSIDKFPETVSKIAEVTVPGICKIPNLFHTGSHPNGPWNETKLS